MSAPKSREDVVQRARDVLRDALLAAGVSPFTAMAIQAATESYVKALKAAMMADDSFTIRARSVDEPGS